MKTYYDFIMILKILFIYKIKINLKIKGKN